VASAAPAMPGAQGPITVKGAQSDPNYVSRLLLDCVPVFHEIITPRLVAWHIGRTSVSDWRTFAVLSSTCS